MTGDRTVLLVAIGILLVLIGMGVGEDRALHAMATECLPQQGAALMATHQNKEGVVCVYVDLPRPEYGRVVRKKKATRT